MLMICGEYVEIMLIFAQYSIHILSNQQLVTSTQCGRQTLAVEAVRASERSLDDFGLTLDSHPLDFSCLVVGPNDRCLTVTESSHVVRGDCLE